MSEMRDAGGDGEEKRVREQSRVLKEKIARAQGAFDGGNPANAAQATRDMSGWNRGMRLGTEFIAAILVGAVAGYLLDRWLNTAPWIMLVMLMIGFAAGVLNVVRAADQMNKASPPPPGSDLGPGKDEDED